MADPGTSERHAVKGDGRGTKRSGADDTDEVHTKPKRKRKADYSFRRETTVIMGTRETVQHHREPSLMDMATLQSRGSTFMDFDLNRQETSVEMSNPYRQNSLLDMTDSSLAMRMSIKTEPSQMDEDTSLTVTNMDHVDVPTPLGMTGRHPAGIETVSALQSGLTHTLINMNIKQEPSTIEMKEDSFQATSHAKKSILNRKNRSEHNSIVRKKLIKNKNSKSRGGKIAQRKEKLKIIIRIPERDKAAENIPGVNCSEAGVVVKCEPVSYYEVEMTSQSQNGEPSMETDLIPAGRRSKIRKTKPRKPAPCTLCQRVFCSFSSLKRHNISMHSADTIPVSCSTCGAVFNKEYKLRAHVRKEHDGDRAFPCKDCHLVFTRACHLKVHVRKHTGERPFKCEVEGCGSTFRCTSNLNRHMQKHSGLRPYVCTVCQADFYQSSHLVSHIRKHTGERPFKCNRCDADFRQLTHLHRHRVKHTGVKPHVCSVCGLGFVEKCTLTKHVRAKHSKPGKPTASVLIASIRKKKSCARRRQMVGGKTS